MRTVIRHPAGVATPLHTMPGHYSVDRIGDWMPTIAADRFEALQLLDERAHALADRPTAKT